MSLLWHEQISAEIVAIGGTEATRSCFEVENCCEGHMLRREFLSLSSGAALVWPFAAQSQSVPSAVSPDSASPAVFAPLRGRWVRKDGGYVIAIKAVDMNGKIDAAYANPNPLPFYTAAVTSDGGVLKLFFELRAGGYNGSTYALTFDAANDQLVGVYYQAVARQKFDVVFERAK